MASGGNRDFRDAITATGVSMDRKVCGFRPIRVVVENVTAGVKFEWDDTMADASAIKTAADGTRTMVTVNGITPLAGGFTLGADASINIANGVLHIQCWE
jgi:hypothetical protein